MFGLTVGCVQPTMMECPSSIPNPSSWLQVPTNADTRTQQQWLRSAGSWQPRWNPRPSSQTQPGATAAIWEWTCGWKLTLLALYLSIKKKKGRKKREEEGGRGGDGKKERKKETKKHFSDLRNIHLHCGKAQLLPLAAVASLGSPPSTVTSGNGTHLPQTCTSAQLANFLSLPQNNLFESYQVQQHYPIFILLYFCTAFNTEREEDK